MTSSPAIVFYGTPDFAVGILEAMLQRKILVKGVVTTPDKPAGRGRKPQPSPVKLFAKRNEIPLAQPEKLKDPAFLTQLKIWSPDLQVVVAFRMMPEVVWAFPNLGTFNLHTSLLPQYRGAAPIQRALMNGEKETGVTTFFINHKIDTGRIIMQEKIPILPEDNAGTLTEKLKKRGAALTLKTIELIGRGNIKPVEQPISVLEGLKTAPKITKEDLQINWEESPEKICNRIRALSPVPGARTRMETENSKQQILKIFCATPRMEKHHYTASSFVTDQKTYLNVAVNGGFVSLQEVQLEGRKKMNIRDFLKGFHPENFTLLP